MTEPTEPATASSGQRAATTAAPSPHRVDGPGEAVTVVAVTLLLAVACAPLTRVFIGLDWARPVAAAVLLAVGSQVLGRRAGLGTLGGLTVGAAAWALFTALAFLPETLLWSVVPTLETLVAAVDLFQHGIGLIEARPTPTFAEPGLMVLVVTGVWWVSTAVDLLAVRLGSPLHAVAAALVLWTVPLAVAPGAAHDAWRWAVPMLIAALVALVASGDDERRRWAARPAAGRRRRAPLGGWVTGGAAITAGALLASSVPGFAEPPLVRAGGGGMTITENPMVSIRSDLVEQSDEPVARVRSPQAVYLRTTALDRFVDGELWTSDGIAGRPATGRLPAEADQAFNRFIDVDVEVLGITGGHLVPSPYQVTEIDGEGHHELRWDPTSGTVAMGGGSSLNTGDTYSVTSGIPDPPPEALADADIDGVDPAYTELPDVPDAVVELAEGIVAEAGADSPFDKAMAIQDELKTWEYSLEPPRGHGASAMESFIETRVGYCEQYAGTMAVMLRSLDVPARVAVGFTPGERVGDEEFLVRRANAHAWVEVMFPGYGWILFEPTPRSDGNLLTPTGDQLAPTELDVERGLQPEVADDFDLGPDDGLDPEHLAQMPDDAEDFGLDDPQAAGDDRADADGRAAWWGWPLAVLLALAAAGGLVAARRRADRDALVPSDVVLGVLGRLERLGDGLGVSRRPVDTDAELLARLLRRSDHRDRLVSAVERARWAPLVPREHADAAADAEGPLRAELLGDRGRLGRTLVVVRGAVRRARRRLRRRRA